MSLSRIALPLLALLMLAGLPETGRAQVRDELDDFAQRDKSFGVGASLYDFGIGIDFRYFTRWKDRWEWAYDFTLANIKDPREFRRESNFSDRGGRSFVLDKTNFAYTISGTFGLNRVVFPHTAFNRLSMRFGVHAGPTFAFLKPYLIEFLDNAGGNSQVVVEQFDHTKHDPNFILGEADFFSGFDRLQFVPGLKVALTATINLAGSAMYIRAVNLALQGEFFTKKLNILDQQPNDAVYIGGKVGFMIGNAW